MLEQLLLTNIYFIIHVFAALAFFASGWIHLDSWRVDKKNTSYLARSVGFFSVSISLLIASSQNTNWILVYGQNIFNLYGALMIFISLVASPLSKKPKAKIAMVYSLPVISGLSKYFIFISPIIFIAAAIAYFVRVIKGLEKQIKEGAIAILIFAVAENLKLLYLWSDSNIVYINNLLAKNGPVTLIILTLLFISSVILFKWVLGYVRFRAGVQIFITTLTSTLAVFMITTVAFTYFLLKNVEGNVLDGLETSANIVQYSIEKLQFEALANAKAVTGSQELIRSIEENDNKSSFDFANSFMLNQNLNFLNITDREGKVLAAGEDQDLKNISLSDDPVVKSAIDGKPLATIYTRDSALAPVVEVKASAPIFSESGDLIGTAVAGFFVDSAFLDGIKASTGIEIDIYGGAVKSASTIIVQDNNTRLIGTKITDPKILDSVLVRGSVWKGRGQIANKPFYLVYVPLKKYGAETIGMISTGKPQSILSATAQKSIDSTFLVSAILIGLSVSPAYFISKYIEENITA